MGRTHSLVSEHRFATVVSACSREVASEPLARAIRAASVIFVAAATAAAAQVSVHLPFTPVPFTLQPMVVLLGAAALGSRLGCYSQLLYLAAGIAGLPVFAASPLLPPGALRLLGPTGGYLMSYPFAALVVGALAERGFDRRYVRSVAAMAAGLAIIYMTGVLWLALFAQLPQAAGWSTALVVGAAPFFVADLMKILLAAAILPGAWKLLG